MLNQGASKVENQIVVEVMGELPYYVPFPEGIALAPSLIGAAPFRLYFQHFRPPRPPGAAHGEGADDRRGTYLKSRVFVEFPVKAPPNPEELDEYSRKALNLTNKALLSIRYVASDPAMRHVEAFENFEFHVWETKADESKQPVGMWSVTGDFGPFGLTAQAHLTNDAVNKVWFIFNDLAPINPSRILVLDAQYHNAVGDIRRAILDLGTALEIHVPALIDMYARVSKDLATIETEGKSIWAFYDEILLSTVGHSMHEQPDLFVKLEFIRGLRNSVAHRWKPEFRITPDMEKKSRYLSEHRTKDGFTVTSNAGVNELIEDTIQIHKHVLDLFKQKYGPLRLI